MKQNQNTDTIAAIATARGLGGIGIIRVSGEKSLPILRAMFSRKARPQAEAGSPAARSAADGAPRFEPRRLEFGWALDADGAALDEVLAVYMPGPRTFSGEDIVEIHCHGGRAVLDAVLESALRRGARLAEPGEFTRRAFLNGRLDLSQAEAVAEMIAAPSLEGVYLARNKLEGRLGQSLREMRAQLDWLRARLYLAIDFPEDAEDEFDAESPEAAEFRSRVDALLRLINQLIMSYERARVWREGALAALAGQVNVGKSSLLNALLGRRRALVSDTPGTTRDFIEESVNLAGLPVRLVDTAGLRGLGQADEQEAIEAEGIGLAREIFEQADAILLIIPADRVTSALERLAAPQGHESQPSSPEVEKGLAPWRELEKVWAGLVSSFDQAEAAAAGLSREDVELLAAYGSAGAVMPGEAEGNEAACGSASQDGGHETPCKSGRESDKNGADSPRRGRLALVFNKLDLSEALQVPPSLLGCPCFGVSARSGLGLDELAAGLREFIGARSGSLDFASEAAPNLRQSEKLKEVRRELEALRSEYAGAIPADLLSVRLDTAAAYLAEVIGSSGTEDLLDQVFSSFCIGK